MMKYSDKIVRCNLCMHTFPKEKDVKYSCSFGEKEDPKRLCSKCKKGHLWLIDIKVDEEQLKKDKIRHTNPSHSENVKNAIHKSDRDMPDRTPNFGTRLAQGFRMLDGDA